jgi:hypothetical protein
VCETDLSEVSVISTFERGVTHRLVTVSQPQGSIRKRLENGVENER